MNEEDPWALDALSVSATEAPATLGLTETVIGDVEPLGADVLGGPSPNVPDALHGFLFGQAWSGQIAASAAPPAKADANRPAAYAILDASKIVGLPEIIESSGLEHRCLFRGAAYDNLKDAAPWIVRLEEANRFTRNLFTQGDAPWQMWSAKPAIYLRSRAMIDELASHFRRFTRARDRRGNWFYFRFYEPDYLPAYLRSLDPSKRAYFFGKVEAFICPGRDAWLCVSQSSSSERSISGSGK